MRFMWQTALKDWRRQRRNPAEFALWLGIPLIIGALIIMASGGKSGPRPQVHLLVADQDDSFLSGMLLGALSQEAMGGLIRAEEVEEKEGRERMADGKASALLVIPDGFALAVLREEPVTLRLLTNPAQRIMPGIVEESLSILADAGFYLHRLIGDQLRVAADGPPAGRNTFQDAFITQFSLRINHTVDRLVRYLDPLVIRLEAEPEEAVEKDEDAGFRSMGLFFVPSILFMSLLFMAQGLSGELWTERMQRTLRRVVISPRSVWSYLAGKMLATWAMMLAVCMVALAIGYAYFGLGPLSWPLAVTWASFSGAMLLAGMILLQVWSPSQQGASVISIALVFPLMMIGGSFFPFEAMPPWMQAVGAWTPNGWALLQLKQIILQQADLPTLLLRFCAMIGVTGGLFVLSGLRLRNGFAQG